MENTRERVPARLSRQLKLMSYWTMVAVVLIHAYNSPIPSCSLPPGSQRACAPAR